MNRFRFITALGAVLIASSLAAQPVHQTSPTETLAREELIATVLAQNPRVDAARHAIAASRERITLAESWEDPRLSVGLAPLTIDDSSIGSRVELAQEIPWPGRIDARVQGVTAGVAMQEAELEAVQVSLGLQASMLYDRWYLVHRGLELNQHHRRLVEQMKASAESQYVVGNAAQQDPLQAEVRITRLARERTELEADRRMVRAAMNALMHREPASEIPPPPAAIPVPVASVPAGTRPPMVLAAEAAIGEAEAEKALAVLEKRPDLMAMGEYSTMFMGDHRYMLGLSLRLPVRRERIAAMVRASEAELESRKAALEATVDEVTLEQKEALYELESHLETLALYRDLLIPASQDQTEAAQFGFSAGRNSFLAVLDAENNLQEVLLGYHSVLSQAWSAAARLQAAHGAVPFVTNEIQEVDHD